ncbi:MAG: hypothetical protein K0S27_604 [Gammaproteobacteria bacterium]|jgi:hypothetical protein|nr:hypothetical protein [Gammaproteobacteria bacterium]
MPTSTRNNKKEREHQANKLTKQEKRTLDLYRRQTEKIIRATALEGMLQKAEEEFKKELEKTLAENAEINASLIAQLKDIEKFFKNLVEERKKLNEFLKQRDKLLKEEAEINKLYAGKERKFIPLEIQQQQRSNEDECANLKKEIKQQASKFKRQCARFHNAIDNLPEHGFDKMKRQACIVFSCLAKIMAGAAIGGMMLSTAPMAGAAIGASVGAFVAEKHYLGKQSIYNKNVVHLAKKRLDSSTQYIKVTSKNTPQKPCSNLKKKV